MKKNKMYLEDRLHIAGLSVLGSTAAYGMLSRLITGHINEAVFVGGAIIGAALYRVGSRIHVKKVKKYIKNHPELRSERLSSAKQYDIAYEVDKVLQERKIQIKFNPNTQEYVPWYKLKYSVKFEDEYGPTPSIDYIRRTTTINIKKNDNSLLNINEIADELLRQKIRIDTFPVQSAILYLGILGPMHYMKAKIPSWASLLFPLYVVAFGWQFVKFSELIEHKIFNTKYLQSHS